MNILYQLHRT